MTTDWKLALLFFVVAVLYSSVGHAGASGYLAVMALWSIEPATMKPSALVLNILVATVASIRFYRAGYFSWQTFWPFAAASIPFAFLGGLLQLNNHVYKSIVGLVLILSAVRLVIENSRKQDDARGVRKIPLVPAMFCGGGIGLLSGTTGTGGGIFLSPLLLSMRWAEIRHASGVAAVFILVNSIAGLSGNLLRTGHLPHSIWIWAIAVVCGGLIGTELGARRLAPKTLRYLLSVVLVIAGLKLMLT